MMHLSPPFRLFRTYQTTQEGFSRHSFKVWDDLCYRLKSLPYRVFNEVRHTLNDCLVVEDAAVP